MFHSDFFCDCEIRVSRSHLDSYGYFLLWTTAPTVIPQGNPSRGEFEKYESKVEVKVELILTSLYSVGQFIQQRIVFYKILMSF